nr:hypothetical protein CFP56_14329 [Quercus suber]
MNRKLDLKNLKILQTMLTTLWTIWNHRNQVVHEGKCPNSIEIILTSQNLLCRYQNAFNSDQVSSVEPRCNNFEGENGNLSRSAAKEIGRLEEADMHLKLLTRKEIRSSWDAIALVMVLMSWQPGKRNGSNAGKKLGFHHIITLAGSKYLEQVCSNRRKPHWQDLAMQADIQTLRQQGLKLRIITVPGVILTNVLDVALTATVEYKNRDDRSVYVNMTVLG